MQSEDYRAYWDRNIDKWSELYLDISHGHETLAGPRWFASLYQGTIGRIERRLMAERYAETVAFLKTYIGAQTVVSDLGCGTGLFVVEALRLGAASVNAIDFTNAALEITKKNVAKHAPNGRATYTRADVQVDPVPKSDIAVAMGITCYLTDLSAFFANVLPTTGVLFSNFIDPAHWASRVRKVLPFLDVRSLQCYAPAEVDRLYAKHGWELVERRPFATGFLDLAKRR
jgi:predicted TPR repeat methyltransferase